MGLNFNICEKGLEYDYEAVKNDYLDLNLSVAEIREKHGISMGRWNTIVKHFKKDGVPLRIFNKHPRQRTNPCLLGVKNYTFDKIHGVYVVYKTVNGKRHDFGRYLTEEEAIDKVCELRANNWEGLLK